MSAVSLARWLLLKLLTRLLPTQQQEVPVDQVLVLLGMPPVQRVPAALEATLETLGTEEVL